MTPQEEAIDIAEQELNNIQLSNTSEGLAIACLLDATKALLDVIRSRFKYKYHDSEIMNAGSQYQILKHMRMAKMYSSDLVPSELNRDQAKDVVSNLKGLGIRMVMEDDTLWVEEWLKVAYQQYHKNEGFAGLSFKKYICKMRPLAESTSTNKKRVFSKQRIDGGDTVEEEVLYNVKRKVRQKAPRLKNRMGHI